MNMVIKLGQLCMWLALLSLLKGGYAGGALAAYALAVAMLCALIWLLFGP